MKIGISSTESDFETAGVDPRFGRCNFFIIYDTETKEYKAYPNPAKEAVGGAAMRAVEFLREKGVEKVITGNVGPNAESALGAAGIELVKGVTGKVKEAVERYK